MAIDDKKELINDLEQFKYSVERLMTLEDELALISEELKGETLHSPTFKSKDEAKYQKGTMIYHNNIPELLDREECLINERDYYLFRVRRVAMLLQKIAYAMRYDEKVLNQYIQLLELRYWHRYSIRAIAEMMYFSKSTVLRKFDIIFEFWDMSREK